MFDPVLVINRHIALLTLLKAAEDDVKESKGVTQSIAKLTGRLLVRKLDQSRMLIKENKMWMQDKPIGEGRYQYSLLGQRNVHEITPGDIRLNVGMILREMEQELEG